MGHYRSEMMSDEEFQAERKKREAEDKMMRDGARALRKVFGKNAEAVAFFLLKTSSSRPGETTPEQVSESFKRHAPRGDLL